MGQLSRPQPTPTHVQVEPHTSYDRPADTNLRRHPHEQPVLRKAVANPLLRISIVRCAQESMAAVVAPEPRFQVIVPERRLHPEEQGLTSPDGLHLGVPPDHAGIYLHVLIYKGTKIEATDTVGTHGLGSDVGSPVPLHTPNGHKTPWPLGNTSAYAETQTQGFHRRGGGVAFDASGVVVSRNHVTVPLGLKKHLNTATNRKSTAQAKRHREHVKAPSLIIGIPREVAAEISSGQLIQHLLLR